MEQAAFAIGTGIAVFASTNVDDILLLAAFFADPAFARRQIVAGQFLGIAALTAVSAACALLAVAVPPGWIGLLGFAPLALGLRGLWKLRRAAQEDSGEKEERPRHAGSRVLAVAGVTIANGGDNLGVYIPLFSSAPRLVPFYAAVFAVLTGAWCAAGYYLVNNPILGKRIGRYGRVALPFVLVALGAWILYGARVLLPKWGA